MISWRTREVRKTSSKYDMWFKKQPNTTFVGDVEVPSYQNFWERTMKLENKINSLKVSILVLSIAITVLSASVIAISLKLLK